ncbi:MAG: hypothetical protein HZB16_13990 [Armatimonadetes bacterium]|nr:hypothetical protein [Armatimonadota bacterium]
METTSNVETAKMLSQLVRLVSLGVAEEVYAAAVIPVADGGRESITCSQFEVLRYIDRHELPTVKEVADGLRMSSAAVTKAVRGLSEERRVPLVQRGRGSDRRTVRLTSTAAGHDLVRVVRAEIDRRVAGVLERMGEPDRAALTHGLRQFLLSALVSQREGDIACLRCGVDHNDLCAVHCAGFDADLCLPTVGAE